MKDYNSLPLPAYVLHEADLIKNLALINSVKESAGVSIILALKGFAMWSIFPIIRQYLDGGTASSLHEALLIQEHMGHKAHTYCAAYAPEDFEQIMSLSSHVTFNSLSEYQRYRSQVLNRLDIKWGLRVNPGYAEVETELYNPCAPGSRLGIPHDQLKGELPEGISGLHFHALCENDSHTLERVLHHFEKNYAHLLTKVSWVNFGGGHLMTRKGYDTDHLIQLLKRFKEKWQVDIILEPGSAIGWQTGDLVARVLDIVENHHIKTAMLDVSFTAHMPDTLEMPYKPAIEGATDPVPSLPTYRMGGMSCLSGDYIGDYSFQSPLQVGDLIFFKDMMHYTMVKTTTFNGVRHPSIAILRKNGQLDLVKIFTYEDYRNRLS
jgi:carboxynorspermidine decarboxylase